MDIIVFTVANHCMKNVYILNFSSPHFPEFGLNTDKYSVSLRIQSECRKIWTKKTPNTEKFYAVNDIYIFFEQLFNPSITKLLFHFILMLSNIQQSLQQGPGKHWKLNMRKKYLKLPNVSRIDFRKKPFSMFKGSHNDDMIVLRRWIRFLKSNLTHFLSILCKLITRDLLPECKNLFPVRGGKSTFINLSSKLIFLRNQSESFLQSQFRVTLWTQTVNWTYIRCSEKVQDFFWKSYVQLLFLCLNGWWNRFVFDGIYNGLLKKI